MAKKYPCVYIDPNGKYRLQCHLHIDNQSISMTIRGYEKAEDAYNDLLQARLMVKGRAFHGITEKMLRIINHNCIMRGLKTFSLPEIEDTPSKRANERYLLSDLVIDYQRFMSEIGTKNTTIFQVKSNLNNIVYMLSGDDLEEAFSKTALRCFRNRILSAGRGVRWKNMHLGLLKAFAEYLHSERSLLSKDQLLMVYNTCKPLKNKKITGGDIMELRGRKILNDEQIKAFLNTFDKTDKKQYCYYALFSLLALRAPRIGELIGLYVSNCNFDKLQITIDHQYSEHTNNDEPTKNNKIRIIPISEDLSKILQKHIANYNLQPSDRLFLGKKAFIITTINYIRDKHCNLAGVPLTWNHAFRKKIASDTLNDPNMTMANQAYISQMLGHDLTTDLKNYARVKELENAQKTTVLDRFKLEI